MREFNVTGLTVSETKVLATISASEKDLTFDKITELSGVHRSSIPRVLASLMRRGYLTLRVPYKPLPVSVSEVFAGDMEEECEDDEED
jgi:sugar-specific transcriptional regulator TrmB